MKTKLQIKTWGGELLFEYESENNTLKKTLEAAIKSKANLFGANLYRADLSGANLYRADLSGADLFGANLYRADLSGAKGIKDILQIGPIGSRKDYLIALKLDDGNIEIRAGCFVGSIKNFMEAVKKTHGKNDHGKAYKLAMDLVKLRFREEG